MKYGNLSQKQIELEEYNKHNIHASEDDMELDQLISYDMGTIWNEVDGQDGMYENFPITRFYRGKNGEPHRAYALDGNGGIAIFAYYDKKTKKCNMWKIVTLGEDDAYHFLNSQNLYSSYFGEKSDFLSILSEAISIMNNNI